MAIVTCVTILQVEMDADEACHYCHLLSVTSNRHHSVARLVRSFEALKVVPFMLLVLLLFLQQGTGLHHLIT